MATRSNIRISDGSNSLWIYRHWDGYPAETGRDIAQTIKRLKRLYHGTGFAALSQKLLDKRYPADNFRPEPRPIYEVTDGEHGDIEYLYEIAFKNGRASVKVTELKWSGDEKKRHLPIMMTEQQFRDYCAKDLREMLNRIRSHNRKHKAA